MIDAIVIQDLLNIFTTKAKWNTQVYPDHHFFSCLYNHEFHHNLKRQGASCIELDDTYQNFVSSMDHCFYVLG